MPRSAPALEGQQTMNRDVPTHFREGPCMRTMPNSSDAAAEFTRMGTATPMAISGNRLY